MNSNQSLSTSPLISLDVFRGITVAVMILVNSPGNRSPYVWLEHAAWNGCTVADLVFPFFIVIVGISSVFSLSTLRAKGLHTPQLLEKVIRRSVTFFIIGLLLNAFPHHFDVSSIRILGVLQRIAFCYFFSSLLFLTTRPRTQAMIMIVLLMGYGCFILTLAPLTLDENVVGYLDQLVFSSEHLYTSRFDPEGLLSTLPAIASALLGNLMGLFLLSSRRTPQTLFRMTGAGLLLMFLGWIWSDTLPLNKALWSSSYVLWTGGLALLVFACIYWIIEIKQQQRWFKPFNLLGCNAMLAYILHVLFLKIQAMIHLQNAAGVLVSFRLYITEVLFGYMSLENAALFYALGYILLWLLVIKGIDTWRQWGGYSNGVITSIKQ